MDKKVELINKSKNYLENLTRKGIDINLSAFAYLCSFGVCPGYLKLKKFSKKSNFLYDLIIIISEILKISNLNNYSIINSSKHKNNTERLIISWARKEDFCEDGSYNDRYFKINSKDLNESIWLVLYLDEIEPKKIAENIRIFKKKKDSQKINVFFLIKTIFQGIRKYGISLKFFHYTSWLSLFATIFEDEFKKEFGKPEFKTIIMPYEAQPFQNNIIGYLKNVNNKIKIIGYVHAFPPALPTHYVFKSNSPDVMILNGEDQLNCFKNYLGWPISKLKIYSSFRFTSEYSNLMENKIFLPIAINNKKIILDEIKNFINRENNNSINFLEVRNHPHKLNSRVHLDVKKKIMEILNNNRTKFTYNKEKNTSIFVGNTSSAIEALERGINVLHLCPDIDIDLFSEKLLPNLKVTKLSKHLYAYKLQKKNSLICFGNKDNNLNNFLLNEK